MTGVIRAEGGAVKSAAGEELEMMEEEEMEEGKGDADGGGEDGKVLVGWEPVGREGGRRSPRFDFGGLVPG